MGIEEITKEVNETLELRDKKLVHSIIQETFVNIQKKILEGQRVSVTGIGMFYVDIRKSRKFPRIDKLSQMVTLPSVWVPKIKWSPDLKSKAKQKTIYDASS